MNHDDAVRLIILAIGALLIAFDQYLFGIILMFCAFGFFE